MRKKLAFVPLLAILAAAALTVVPTTSAAPATLTLPATCTSQTTGLPAPCTLQLVGFSGSGGTLSAVLQLTNGLTGQTQQFTVPITNVQQGSTCTILDLTLGPIDLFLLGLRVQTNEIHLLVTAQRGTLLGDLLCGLFFNGTATQPLVRVLNALLAAGNIRVA
jgi:hypothetical protein